MLDPSRSRIVLGELPLGLPHRGAVVVEDYRPARRRPLVYRQYIISCHYAFSFRYTPRTASRAASPYNTYHLLSWFSRACAAEPFPFSDHAPLLALSIASVTEPNTRVKDLSHRHFVIAGTEAGQKEDYRSIRRFTRRRSRREYDDMTNAKPCWSPSCRRAHAFPGGCRRPNPFLLGVLLVRRCPYSS